jgi:uncharacterized protein (DUF4415 family)
MDSRKSSIPKTKDPEVLEFEAALLRSVGQAVRGEYAAVRTPEQIAARKRSRQVGTVESSAKVSTSIRLDVDAIDALKATGRG